MPTSSRSLRLAAVGACAAAAAVAGTAGAQETKPVPTSCAGLTFTDAAGDQSFTPTRVQGQTVPSARKARENLDVLDGFFRYVPEGGKNVLTANIHIANLDKELEEGATSAGWYFKFKLGDVLNYVLAEVDGEGAVTYSYGTQAGTQLTETGATTGKLFEGPDGIVQIVVPSALKLDGKTLATPYAVAGFIEGTGPVGPFGGASLSNTADNGPDDTTKGKNFVATPCAEAGTQTPISGGTGGGGGGTTPGGTPGGTPPAAGPATLDLKVTVPKLSAKKLKKSKRFTVKLQAGESITGLAAKLLKGKKAVGTGRLASIAPGAGKLKLKLARKAAKKFKKGTYTLSFSGTKADGRKASGSVRLRVSK